MERNCLFASRFYITARTVLDEAVIKANSSTFSSDERIAVLLHDGQDMLRRAAITAHEVIHTYAGITPNAGKDAHADIVHKDANR